ncbi:MAG: UDP-glucose/GDP-mannose dehydrogenase family protein [Candidatus Micrarchaeota archaeon]
MHITIVGVGYVGLITSVGFAKLGYDVTCVDIDKTKVDLINSGNTPIFEAGLSDLLLQVIGNTLNATTNLQEAVQSSNIIFLCVGTPSMEDGSMDISYIQSAFIETIRSLKSYATIVVKSTVIPGTTDSLAAIAETQTGKVSGKDYGLCMNPEFLREGKALDDFFNPDRIVIGQIDDKSGDLIACLYERFKCPLVRTDLKTAEMIKYASNAFLATKISFSNEIGNLCKQLGIDYYIVADAIGQDKRINRSFLNAGIGYGGSCFPKDINAIVYSAKRYGCSTQLLDSVISINNSQPLKLIELAKKKITLKNTKITVLGVAFKPDTDDIRDAPSLKIIDALIHAEAIVTIYDPQALENAQKIFGNKVIYAASAEKACKESDIIFLLTEWSEFVNEKLYIGKLVFDGRKILKKKSGKDYEGICW